jgi:hypothetical protein
MHTIRFNAIKTWHVFLNINLLVFVAETQCVSCEVRTVCNSSDSPTYHTVNYGWVFQEFRMRHRCADEDQQNISSQSVSQPLKCQIITILAVINSMVWVREWTIPTERPPLVGEMIANFLRIEGATFSVTDPYGRILGFLDRTRYFSIK